MGTAGAGLWAQFGAERPMGRELAVTTAAAGVGSETNAGLWDGSGNVAGRLIIEPERGGTARGAAALTSVPGHA